MLFAALRDMQWRSRRLAIAVVSTGLVFAMTLVLTGLANGFHVEAQRTVGPRMKLYLAGPAVDEPLVHACQDHRRA